MVYNISNLAYTKIQKNQLLKLNNTNGRYEIQIVRSNVWRKICIFFGVGNYNLSKIAVALQNDQVILDSQLNPKQVLDLFQNVGKINEYIKQYNQSIFHFHKLSTIDFFSFKNRISKWMPKSARVEEKKEKPHFSDDKLKKALLNWDLSIEKVDKQLEAVREFKTENTLNKQPLQFNPEGIAYLHKDKTGLPLTMEAHQSGHLFVHRHQQAIEKNFIGSGEVKKGYRSLSSDGEIVANLVMKADKIRNSPQNIDQEIKILKELKGIPFIIQFLHETTYEGKNQAEKRGMTLEYCDLGTVSDFLEEKNFRSKVKVLSQIAQGLAALHKKGYVYCDIREENFLMKSTQNGFEPRIIDFGFAHPTGSEVDIKQKLIAAYGVMLPPEFGSPEEIFRKACHHVVVSKEFDVWAFGIYMMLHLMKREDFIREATHLYFIPGKVIDPHDLRSIKGLMEQDFFFQNLSMKELIELVMSMIDPIPEKRPTMITVQLTLQKLLAIGG